MYLLKMRRDFMNYSSLEPYVFSPKLQQIRDDLLGRVRCRDDREMTYTNHAYDGKTPFLDAFERYANDPYIVKLAHAIADSWLVSETVVYPGDILVGLPRPIRPVYEHFSHGVLFWGDMDTLLSSPAYKSKQASIRSRIAALKSALLPLDDEYMHNEGRLRFGSEVYDAMTQSLWWTGGYQGHTVPSYPVLLELGIDGTREKILHYAELYRSDKDKQIFYRAQLILLDGFSAYAEGYATKLESIAESSDTCDTAQLLRNAATCRHIAHRKPETLHHALQLCWFYSLWDWVDCIGRLDQYLYPFYVKCVETEGTEAAADQIAAFWLKIYEHGVHNLTIGGVDPDTGRDCTNELSYLLLQIGRANHETHPRFTVRFHENSPRELMALVVKMWAEGMSDPAVASDSTIIPALEALEIPRRDASDYTMLGCQEIEIPGKSNFGCEDGAVNLAKVFELTINNGRDRESGLLLGLETGYLTDHASIDSLWQAYTKQVCHFTKHFVDLCNLGVDIRAANASKLVKSLYTEACIERGLDHDNGGPLYNPGVVETCGTAAVGDSFAAIDKLVFREKQLNMDTLRKAIDADFRGYEDIQRLLRYGAPKFGNDDAFADDWCRRVTQQFWTEIGKYRSRRGGKFTGACSLLTKGIAWGKVTWALPDGRNYGEPLGNTIGPREGNDTNGVTAMLRSVSKLPLELGVGGTTVNVLLPKSQLQNDKVQTDVAAMMTAFLLSGGQLAQITTADLQEMKDAQKEPEKHGNLIVRVGGFSIHFTDLETSTQNEIISRYA